VRIAGDQPDLVIGQRPPSGRSTQLHQPEHQILLSRRDREPEPVQHVIEPRLAPVLTGQHHPPLAREPVVRERPECVIVVQFVVAAILERPVGVNARLVRERVPAHPRPGGRQRLPERIGRPQPEPPRPRQVDRIADFDRLCHAEAMLESQDARKQIGIAGPLAYPVHARVNPGVLPRVKVTEGTGDGVRDGQTNVVMTMGLYR
jgi:hypothetical protein